MVKAQGSTRKGSMLSRTLVQRMLVKPNGPASGPRASTTVNGPGRPKPVKVVNDTGDPT